MKVWTMALGGLALGAGAAAAGDIERSQQSVGILFEEGRYAEFTFGAVNPDVSGSVGGLGSGNMAGNFNTWSLGYKQPLGANMDLALILDQPIGADVDYPDEGLYPLAARRPSCARTRSRPSCATSSRTTSRSTAGSARNRSRARPTSCSTSTRAGPSSRRPTTISRRTGTGRWAMCWAWPGRSPRSPPAWH